MRVGTPGFVSERLVEARSARRITSQKELAELIGVSPASVSKWESGVHAPDEQALTLLAGKLRVRREFFLRPTFDVETPIFFRTLASTLKRDLAFQKSQMNWLHEISDVVGHYVDFPVIDIPDVLSGGSYNQLRDEDIEAAALELRAHWDLGEGPCVNVVSVLERIGCIVAAIKMGTVKLDGVCTWSETENRPHILLANDKMSAPRRQMDAAHELGHAVLHRDVTHDEFRRDLKLIEKQAFRFASAFLMPSTSYPYEIRNASLAALLNLKERWRVSVKAQIMRISQLGLIPDDFKLSLYKLYSAKGWNKGEPLDDEWSVSPPLVLRDAIGLIVESGVRSKADLLATEFALDAIDVESITGLPSGWFNRQGEVVKLQLKKSAKIQGGSAEVIPFNLRDR